jgi:hypothetical protein
MGFVPEGQADSSQARSAWSPGTSCLATIAPSLRDEPLRADALCASSPGTSCLAVPPGQKNRHRSASHYLRAPGLDPPVTRDEEPSQTVLIFVPFIPGLRTRSGCIEDCCSIPQRDCGRFSRPSLLSTTVKAKFRSRFGFKELEGSRCRSSRVNSIVSAIPAVVVTHQRLRE